MAYNTADNCLLDRCHIINIAGIVEDLLALSMSCKQTLTSLLRLLYAYRGEADFSVLSHVNTVSLNVAKISVDATPGLVGDIKQVLIKLLLSPAGYVQPCLTLLASQSLKLFHFLACYLVSICACLIKHTLLCNYAPPT